MKKDRITKYYGMKSRRQSVSDFFQAIFSPCAMSNCGEYLEYKSLVLWKYDKCKTCKLQHIMLLYPALMLKRIIVNYQRRKFGKEGADLATKQKL